MTDDRADAVVLTVRQWQTIDAALDNTASTAAQDGDVDTVQRARGLREHGWLLARAHPRTSDGQLGWPPLDDVFHIDLDPIEWQFVRAQLERWAAVGRTLLVSDRLAGTSHAEQEASLALLDDVLAAIDATGR